MTVDGEEIVFINNDFYKNHYDDLFEMYYKRYCEYRNAENPDDYIIAPDAKINKSLYNLILGSKDNFYLSVYLKYEGSISADRNNSILSNTQNIQSILYVGKTTPCAVITVEGGKDIDGILKNDEIDCITLCFSDFVKTVVFTDDAGNISFTPSAADARLVLRYAAGLGGPEKTYLSEYKKFYYLSDTDFNGVINAKDARTVLRIAAGLEKGKYYEVNNINTGSFWSQ